MIFLPPSLRALGLQVCATAPARIWVLKVTVPPVSFTDTVLKLWTYGPHKETETLSHVFFHCGCRHRAAPPVGTNAVIQLVSYSQSGRGHMHLHFKTDPGN